MLTYTPQTESNPHQGARESAWALLLLAFAWLWPGVFSHDLWNPGEPRLYTVVEQFLLHPTWQPMLFEQAYFDAPPVWVWMAALCNKLLSPWAMDAYAAARTASVIFTALGLLGSAMAAYRLLGKHQGRSVVLILIGSVGLLPIAHFMNGFSVLFAALGMIFWAFSIAHKQVVFACIVWIFGQFLLMQSGGLLLPFLVLLAALALRGHPQWRSARFDVFCAAGAVLSLPVLAFYPLALAAAQPQAFERYWQEYLWGAWGGTQTFSLGFSLFYYAKHLLWFSFPALLLAIWTLWRGGVWQQKYGALCAIWFVLMGLALTSLPQTQQNWLLLLLLPLAVLGAAQLNNLRRGAAAFLNWFGIMTFGVAAVFLWLGFVAMNFGFPAKLAERAAYFSPYYTRDLDILPIFFALLFTPIWIFAITRRHIRGRQAISNWAAGMTLVWALLMSLFLPWIDAAKSYRPIVQQMQLALPETVRHALVQGEACLAIDARDDITRIAWQQYSTLRIQTHATHKCRYQLARRVGNEILFRQPEQVIWQGNRPRNKEEQFILWQQSNN